MYHVLALERFAMFSILQQSGRGHPMYGEIVFCHGCCRKILCINKIMVVFVETLTFADRPPDLATHLPSVSMLSFVVPAVVMYWKRTAQVFTR